MNKRSNILSDVRLIIPKTLFDARGYFRETYSQREKNILQNFSINFVQDNESLSRARGTVRGLHFQRVPHAQAKLVRVVCGAIFDVVVDLRQSSPTFGRWEGYEITSENGYQLFVPIGFAHGFCTLVENTVVCYKVSDYYAPDCDAGVIWSDPEIGINWPLKGPPILSEKDAILPTLAELGAVF